MDVDTRVPRFMKNQKKNKGKKKYKSSLKVVYISTPMKVKTSASRFRSLVQHLTGKNSDVSQYMDEMNNTDFHDFDCDVDDVKDKSDEYRKFSSISPEDTPTSSESSLGPIDNVFTSQMEEQFAGVFSSDFFCDPSHIDVLGSYDELL